MLKYKKILFLTIFALVFFGFSALAQEESPEAKTIDLYFFEGQGCPHCAKMKSYLEGLKVDYPNLKVYEFEVYFNEESQVLYSKMAGAYGVSSTAVPMVFIGDEFISGADFEKVKNVVEKCSSGVACPSPMERIDKGSGGGNDQVPSYKNYETVGWIVLGGVIIIGSIFTILFLKKKNV